MSKQSVQARIAPILGLVIIGIAVLTVAVPSVVVAFWVLLMAIPVLAALWLVRNLLTGAAQDNPARVARIMALVIIGVALVAAGLSSVMTLWTSSFARFMLIEDLGLEGTTAGTLAHVTPVDRGLLMVGGILAVLGAASLIAAAVSARHRRPAGHRCESA